MTAAEHLRPHGPRLFDLSPLIMGDRQTRATLTAKGLALGYAPYIINEMCTTSSRGIASSAIDMEEMRVLTEFGYVKPQEDPHAFASSPVGRAALKALEKRASDTAEVLRATGQVDDERFADFCQIVAHRPTTLPAGQEAAVEFLLKRYRAREYYLEALSVTYMTGAPIEPTGWGSESED